MRRSNSSQSCGLGALLRLRGCHRPARVLGSFHGQSTTQAAENRNVGANEQPGCCDAAQPAQQLALANPRVQAASARIAAEGKKPNIVFIMGDDIGMWNIGAYHRGMMAGRTPNLDNRQGRHDFTDYYAEASCTAGRANFITGELPIRTGMTTVGQAGAKIGIPAEACTIATALEAQGYETGQFGKNHLGDLNEYLPTVHGFDEFFGYLYHLDAMEDPAHPNYPQELLNMVGPRNMVHRGPPRSTTRPRCRDGARSASRRSRTPERSIPNGWRRWMTRSATSP